MNNSKIRVKFKRSCLKQGKVIFTSRNIVNLFIAYELDEWYKDLNTVFSLKDCLFGAAKLFENNDRDKYFYSDMVLGLTHALSFQSKTHRVKCYYFCSRE